MGPSLQAVVLGLVLGNVVLVWRLALLFLFVFRVMARIAGGISFSPRWLNFVRVAVRPLPVCNRLLAAE